MDEQNKNEATEYKDKREWQENQNSMEYAMKAWPQK